MRQEALFSPPKSEAAGRDVGDKQECPDGSRHLWAKTAEENEKGAFRWVCQRCKGELWVKRHEPRFPPKPCCGEVWYLGHKETCKNRKKGGKGIRLEDK